MSTHRSATGVTALLVVLVSLGLGAALVGVLAVVEARTSSGPTASRASGPQPDDRPGVAPAVTTSPAREVLRAWDRRREAAWAAADQEALAALYLPDSVAGRRDVELLRRWTARGARVLRLEPQVLELTVLRQRAHTLVVLVTDRLGVVETEVAGTPITLPRDEATTRRIELRRGPRTTSRWRVATVRGADVSR